jgi:hypothetical protein
MISLIIPTNGTNKNYTDNLITNIRDLYPNENEVEIVLHVDDTVTLGLNYNNAVAKAKGDKIILLHNDMVISRGFIETMDKHIKKGRITTYTRIEPPIFMDEYPGKVIMDFGSDLTNFNQTSFDLVLGTENLIEGGSQLFFGCMKEDYIGIDGHTFKMFCEDDDLHLRYKLAGFEHKVSSAHVYHFVSKTSRTGDYQNVERNSNINFIRKWGSRTPIVKYNIAYVVKHANMQIVEALEPWCDRLYIEDDMQVITDSYREMEQCNTNFDLTRRIYTTSLNDPEGENDIIVEFDAHKFTNADFAFLQRLPEVIKDNGDIGEFEFDIFKITINSMTEYQNDLIYLKNT